MLTTVPSLQAYNTGNGAGSMYQSRIRVYESYTSHFGKITGESKAGKSSVY